MRSKTHGENIKQRKIEGIHRLAQAYFKARKEGTIEIITVPPLIIKSER